MAICQENRDWPLATLFSKKSLSYSYNLQSWYPFARYCLESRSDINHLVVSFGLYLKQGHTQKEWLWFGFSSLVQRCKDHVLTVKKRDESCMWAPFADRHETPARLLISHSIFGVWLNDWNFDTPRIWAGRWINSWIHPSVITCSGLPWFSLWWFIWHQITQPWKFAIFMGKSSLNQWISMSSKSPMLQYI